MTFVMITRTSEFTTGMLPGDELLLTLLMMKSVACGEFALKDQLVPIRYRHKVAVEVLKGS